MEWYRLEFRTSPAADWWVEWQERDYSTVKNRPGDEFLTREELLKAVAEIELEKGTEYRAYKIILVPVNPKEI